MSALDIQIQGDHYKNFPVQPLEAIFHLAQDIAREDKEGAVYFILGAFTLAIGKYQVRVGLKEGTDDAAKADHIREVFLELFSKYSGKEREPAMDDSIDGLLAIFKDVCYGKDLNETVQ